MALRPERNTVNVNTPAARQADAALDPELKIYLMKLALSWTQAAGETVERELFHMDIFDSHGLRAAMAQAP